MSDLSSLNPAQRAGVVYLDGPCLLLAGAGSGKTRVITQKIAYLIQTCGYAAKHIAALTFTNKAALEMQERLAKLLPGGAAKGVTVCTFHSLGVRLLRAEAAELGLKPQFSILDSEDCLGILQEVLATTDKRLLRQAQSQISLWKNAGLTPLQAAQLASGELESQAARAFASYAATLQAYQVVDFDDLIRLPAALLQENAVVRERWQNRLRYLLVDEYQDTNVCQYRLLKQLVGVRAMFTAVGDDDQSIYGWRGATLENLRDLQADFPALKVIKLEQNYRSSVNILQAANRVIAHNPKLFEKKLWSEFGMGDPVTVVPMNDEEHEAESVVIRLQAHKFERRGQFADYAVLYRSNHQARVLEQALRKERIPYVLSGGQSFFDKAEIRDLISYLRLIANADDDPAFIRAVTTPKRGVGSASLEALGQYAGARGMSLFAALFEAGAEQAVPARQLAPLREFGAFINRLSWEAPKAPAGELLNELLKAIGYEAWLYETQDERSAQSKWQNVLDFVQWLGKKGEEDEKNLLELTQTVALINMLERQDEMPNAVHLSTLHAAKGLEFPHVFLIGVEENILPMLRPDDDLEAAALQARIEEERRLMYVGITRAQRSLTVTWCKKRRRGRDYQINEPSRFIAEMNLAEASPAQPQAQPGNLSSKDRLANLKALLNEKKA
ncbi:ATP-dependent DNA helicase Rep [Parvibium lacunae]|uniref:ATP-dependent DNA helicase Rep n=1 Tax=Parvibium lacunae TaxID=1888893 RepID=A0A368L049_9BURK|nr:UvrD-helicase domain-containing protein [Parvibium lacunae]RCS56651.1 ATP-dependent DNA helicase Rep [Parvibium lacunae]